MHFAIGTTNIPKSEAIEYALSHFPETSRASISRHKVSPGIPDMPITLRDLRTGAKNRAIFTRRINPDADYFVGMEGGVYSDIEGEEHWLVGVVYIEDRDGRGFFGYSSHLSVPQRVLEGLLDGRGRDLEEIIHELTGKENIGDKEGSFGLFSCGLIPRRDAFIQATQAALAPHFSSYYR